MIDEAQIVYDFLTTTATGLYTLCGTRVWHGSLAKSFTNSNAAIEYHRDGGSGRMGSTGVHEGSWVFKCYGGTGMLSSAQSVYRALYDRLQRANNVGTNGSIILAKELTSYPMTDPDTGWPLYVASFLLILQ